MWSVEWIAYKCTPDCLSVSQTIPLFFHYPLCSLCPPFFFTPGPPIITADATQHAVKHSKGKLECRVGSSPPPDKIVSELLICAVCHSLMFESFHTPRSSYSHTHMRWITQRSFIPDLTFTPLHPHISTSRSNKHAPTHAHTDTHAHIHNSNCTDVD